MLEMSACGDINYKYVVEPGDYVVFVGGGSADLPQRYQ